MHMYMIGFTMATPQHGHLLSIIGSQANRGPWPGTFRLQAASATPRLPGTFPQGRTYNG